MTKCELKQEICLDEHPNGVFKCTRPVGHSGNHHLHGIANDDCIAEWGINYG